jgi:hypothetical protein
VGYGHSEVGCGGAKGAARRQSMCIEKERGGARVSLECTVPYGRKDRHRQLRWLQLVDVECGSNAPKKSQGLEWTLAPLGVDASALPHLRQQPEGVHKYRATDPPSSYEQAQQWWQRMCAWLGCLPLRLIYCHACLCSRLVDLTVAAELDPNHLCTCLKQSSILRLLQTSSGLRLRVAADDVLRDAQLVQAH